MARVISTLVVAAVLAVGCFAGAQASDQRVRVYLGVSAAADYQGDVFIHRIYRPRYEASNYRRVTRQVPFFGHRSGGTPGSIAKPKARAKRQQAQNNSHFAGRSTNHHDFRRFRDRIVKLLIAPGQNIGFQPTGARVWR